MMEKIVEVKSVRAVRGTAGLLLFGICGALFWGMRGAPGYGGISGAVVPGLIWGLVWYQLVRVAGGTPTVWIVLACTLGFGLGGYNGYGQYISWIQGVFHITYPETSIPIEPWKGYLYLFATGAGWGGLGGVMLSWIYGERQKWFIQAARLIVLPAGFLAGNYIVQVRPELFMPFYGQIPYDAGECSDCVRTFNTTVGLVSFAFMTVASLLFEALRFNIRSMKIAGTAALGFGIAFAGCAPFHILGTVWPVFDWWKAWEMSLGFVGGATIWLLFKMYQPLDQEQAQRSPHESSTAKSLLVDLPAFLVVVWAFYNSAGVHWGKSIYLHLAVFLMIVPAAGYAVLRRRSRREYLDSYPYGGIPPRDRLLFPLVSLSIMSLIVIWPGYRIMAVFFLLAASAVFIHLRLKAGEA